MKKILTIMMVCVLSFVLAGCETDKNKENNNDASKDTLIAKTIKNLYTDEEKLVYDVSGIYKLVFYYSGNEITGLQHFYEYEDETKAKAKYELDKEDLKNNISIKEISLNGKYVVYTMAAGEYEGTTVDEVKSSYSYLLPVYKD